MCVCVACGRMLDVHDTRGPTPPTLTPPRTKLPPTTGIDEQTDQETGKGPVVSASQGEEVSSAVYHLSATELRLPLAPLGIAYP